MSLQYPIICLDNETESVLIPPFPLSDLMLCRLFELCISLPLLSISLFPLRDPHSASCIAIWPFSHSPPPSNTIIDNI